VAVALAAEFTAGPLRGAGIALGPGKPTAAEAGGVVAKIGAVAWGGVRASSRVPAVRGVVVLGAARPLRQECRLWLLWLESRALSSLRSSSLPARAEPRRPARPWLPPPSPVGEGDIDTRDAEEAVRADAVGDIVDGDQPAEADERDADACGEGEGEGDFAEAADVDADREDGEAEERRVRRSCERVGGRWRETARIGGAAGGCGEPEEGTAPAATVGGTSSGGLACSGDETKDETEAVGDGGTSDGPLPPGTATAVSRRHRRGRWAWEDR